MWNLQFFIFTSVVMSLGVYAMPWDGDYDLKAQNCNQRLQITISLLLAIIALKFSISGHVPRTHHLTWLDEYMIVGFSMVMLSGIETLVVLRCESGAVGDLVNLIWLLCEVTGWVLYHIALKRRYQQENVIFGEWSKKALYFYQTRSHANADTHCSYRGRIIMDSGVHTGEEGDDSFLVPAGAEPSVMAAMSGQGGLSSRAIRLAKAVNLRKKTKKKEKQSQSGAQVDDAPVNRR
jgi:hypothetical protein